MKGKIYLGVFLAIFFIGLISSAVTAEVLVLNLNSAEYSAGASAKVFGYVLEDNLDGSNNAAYTINLDGVLEESNFTDADGYYEHYITNVSTGNHTVNVTTSNSQQILTFTVFAPTAKPSYKVLASSLVVPYRDPSLDFTIKKYLGAVLTNDSYSYTVYYQNGTAYSSGAGVSGIEETVSLPTRVGLYKIKVDNKKSFTVSVQKFSLDFKITNSAGDYQDIFMPNGMAYFEVEGFSNGQRITNASVIATVTNPTGTVKTVTFRETNGVYRGNTNVTQNGNPIQLIAGEYEVEFTMRDSSNNEQTVLGFFTVLGLDVNVELINKKPYRSGDQVEFDVIVKNLADGSLVAHSGATYFFEFEKNGQFYDVASAVASASSDSSITSELVYTIPPGLEDGGYFMRVFADSGSKDGKGTEYVEIMNTDVFVDLKDNYGDYRDIFEPGEGVTVRVESPDTTLQLTTIQVIDEDGNVNLTTSSTINDTAGSLTFTAPRQQGDYLVELAITTDGSTTVYRERWFRVQNYFSYLDVKDINNNFQFIQTAGSTFLAEIVAFDITTGTATDLTGFSVLFDGIVNEETQQEYTNMQTRKNSTYSFDTTGRLVYEITPPTLPDGFYRIDYTIVSTDGSSFSGEGWFGISAFDVDVSTFNSNGQRKELFSAGATINITVELSSPENGTATIHREFFDEEEFDITNGVGSTLLSAAQNELPLQSGFYNFGVDVETDAGETGLGDGFFEIRNLNFRSITVTNEGQYGPSADVVATVVVEKSGSLVNNTNITLARVVRASDWFEITSQFSDSTSPTLTNNQGNTILTLTHGALAPGYYFVELQAEKNGAKVFQGFGFEVVEDAISISIDGDATEFTRNNKAVDIRITVLANDENNTPREDVTVNLTGLLRFDTWSTIHQSKQAVTNSNGVATITYTTNNQTPLTKYAPVIRVAGVTESIVGFGDGEFRVIPFNVNVAFGSGSETFSSNDAIAINISGSGITSSASASCTVRDMSGATYNVECSASAYNSATRVLSLTQSLNPGEYFADVVVTQGSTTTKTLWFEIVSPWMHLESFNNPNFADDANLAINYTVFTYGVGGWQVTNATVNITSIENMWTGNITTVGTLFNATEYGIENFDITSYGLTQGDYFLNFELLENPGYQDSLYFRVDNNVMIFVEPIVSGSNVTLNFSTSGLSESAEYYLEGYMNYQNFEYTGVNSGVLDTGNSGEVNITSLENGFYQANIRIEDGQETFYWDAYFDIRDLDVIITAPMDASVGTVVQFNITNNGANDETFWLIDPFTQNSLYNQVIASGESTNVTYTFNYGGFFIYSYGDNMWDAFPNGRDIQINQAGLSLEWPWQNNNYVLSEGRNFTFNVTADSGHNMTLRLSNHHNGNVTTVNLGASTGNLQEFTFNLQTGLSLRDGPHDVELILHDGSDYEPKEFFFIHIFKSNYDIWVWNDRWEYGAGERVDLYVDVYNVSDFWNKVDADNIEFVYLNDQFGTPINPVPEVGLVGDAGNFNTSSSWTSGNFHGEMNVSVADANMIVPIDFYLRGNDNIDVYWWQNQWDYSMSDTVEITLEVWNGGSPGAGLPVSLVGFEQWTDNWNETPTSFMDNVSGAYSFSTGDNLTDASGSITFYIDLSQTTLETGGYSGRLNIAGRVAWFDFQVRTYMVDAWTDGWDYGITDTITMNVWAKNLDDWSVITENGTVTISEIRKHNPGSWESELVPLTSFGIDNAVSNVIEGNAVIELLPNQTALNLTQMSEFEVKLAMDLDTSQGSEGWGWFQLRTGSRPGATIVDGTGETPEFFFADQTYTLEVTGVSSATLQNIWGPMSQYYGEALLNVSGTFELNFTTPSFPGWYSMDIEAIGASGYPEYMFTDFVIGSGTEMNAWMSGGNSVVPGVNFTVQVDLFGEGEDPWCPNCDWTWFGPLGNETVYLSAIKDLQTFNTRNVSYLGISAITDTFSDSMLGGGMDYVECSIFGNSNDCGNESSCTWTTDPWDQQSPVESCWNLDNICGAYTENQTQCENAGCSFDQFGCFYDSMEEGDMGMGPEEEMSEPGLASFNLHPTILNLTPGDSYELIFEYIDGSGGITQQDLFVQVERFHVAISRNEEDLEPGSTQWVWVLTSDLYGNVTPDCNISFSGIYTESDYQLIDDLEISGATNENGTYVFQYEAPSAPGFYFVEGLATCAVDGEQVTQSIAYFVDIGSAGLEVDMKTRFEPGENIRITIETADRFGEPEQQALELSLFYESDEDANASITRSPTSEVDCTAMIASTYENGPSMENSLFTSTDESGTLILELCPMPQGEYSVDIFPMMNMMDQPMSMEGGHFGYFADFVVGVGEMEILTDLTYLIGDEVNMTVNVTDGDGIPVNGTLIMMDAIMEPIGGHMFSEIILYEDGNITDKLNISVVNGIGYYNFTIPAAGYDEESGNATNISIGTVDVFAMVQGEDNNLYSKAGIQFAIISDAKSSLTVDTTVGVNELIDVSVETKNDARYKAQMGVFFLKDNSANEEFWIIEGGVFLYNDTALNASTADFQILSPKEPGDYFLGIPIYTLETSPKNVEEASEILITPINVRLDSANVTGHVKYHDTELGVYNALVQIGQAETYTDSNGDFSLQVAKGEKQIYVEKRIGDSLKYFIKSDEYNFAANVDELNITLYRANLSNGVITPPVVVINQTTNLTTLRINVSTTIQNDFANSVLLEATDIYYNAKSENITVINISVADTTVSALVVPKNTTGNGYEVDIRLKNGNNNWSSYVNVDGTLVDGAIGTKLILEYNVSSTLAGEEYVGFCGDYICDFETEFFTCPMDCAAQDSFCGDGQIEGMEDCEGVNLGGYNCTNLPGYFPDFGFTGGDLGCFPASYGHMACLFDFQNCTGGDGGPMGGDVDPHLSIMDQSAYNNDSLLHLVFDLDDLSSASYCGGSSPGGPDEYEEWTVGIDSNASGCDIGQCWGQEDYVIYLSMNDSGDLYTGYEFWNGTDLEEDDTVTVTGSINCAGDNVSLYVALDDVNASCDEVVNFRFETWFSDDFGDDMQEFDILSSYTISCVGGAVCGDSNVEGAEECDDGNTDNGDGCSATCMNESAPTSYPESQFTSVTVADDGSTLFVTATMDNLSGMPFCPPTYPNLPEMTDYREWSVTVDSLPGVGCDYDQPPGQCNGTEDHVLLFETNATGAQTVEMEYWNGTDLDLNSGASDYAVGFICSQDKIYFNLSFAETNITECQNITVRALSWYGNITDESAEVIEDMYAENYTVSGDCGPQQTGLFLTVEHNSLPYENVVIQAFDGVAPNTDTNGDTFINWTPGLHSLQLDFDFTNFCTYNGANCTENSFTIHFGQVNITGIHNMTVDVPHIAFSDYQGDMMLDGNAIIPANTESYYLSNDEDVVLTSGNNYNFSIQVENLDTFVINALMNFYAIDNGSNWGGQTVFNDTGTINPSQIAIFTVPFTPTSVQSPRFANVYDAGFLDYLVEFDVGPDSNVVTNSNVEYMDLSVYINMGQIPFNITGE